MRRVLALLSVAAQSLFRRNFAKSRVIAFLALTAFAPYLRATVAATATTLTVSSQSVNSGDVVTLTANVTDSANAPLAAGRVLFCDESLSTTSCYGGAQLGQVWVVRTNAKGFAVGSATLKLRLSVGSHQIRARYVLNANYAASASSLVEVTVAGNNWLPSVTTLTSGTADSIGAYPLTATVTSPTLPAPSGSVNIYDATNSSVLEQVELSASSSSTALAAASQITDAIYNHTSFAVGDINNDGYLDVGVGYYSNSSLTVLTGDAHGNLTTTGSVAITDPYDVHFVDINGDGVLDIIAATYSGSDVVYALGVGDGTFGAPTSIATGAFTKYPVSVTVGDINGDGIPDLIITQLSVSHIYVYFNNGSTTNLAFTVASTEPLSKKYVHSVAVGDFNGDGYDDLAYGGTGGTPYIALTTSSLGYTMSYPLTSLTAAGTLSSGIEHTLTGDLNNDGNLDLIFIGDTNQIAVFLGNGNGSFTEHQTITAVTDPEYRGTLADFYGDGNLDLFLCSYSGVTCYLYRNDGTGTLTLAEQDTANQSHPAVFGRAQPMGIASGDFNGDGHPDILLGDSNYGYSLVSLQTSVTGATTSNVTVYDSSATNTHNVEAIYSGGENYQSSTSSTVALTPVVASDQTVLITLNSPLSSEFTYGTVTSGTVTASGSCSGAVTLSVVSGPASFSNTGSGATLTISGAGSISIAATAAATSACKAATTYQTITVDKATPTLSWSTSSTISIPFGTALSSTELSANSGGVAGAFLYTTNVSGVTTTLTNGTLLPPGSYTVTATFTPTDSNYVSGGTITENIQVTPVAPTVTLTANTDSSVQGTPVALTAHLSYAVPGGGYIAFYDGLQYLGSSVLAADGSSATYTTTTLDGGVHSLKAHYIGSTDHPSATSDALSYTVTANAGNWLTGGASFSVTSPGRIVVGDMNQDGYSDYGVVNLGTDDVTLALGNGNGTFSSGGVLATGISNLVGYGDLNGDGYPDLIAVEPSTPGIKIYYGTGATTFGTGTEYSAGSSPHAVAVADFNADGLLDVAVADAGNNTVWLLMGQSDGTLKYGAATSITGGVPYGIAAADLNGDGIPDLVVTLSDSDKMVVLLGDGKGAFTVGGSYVTGAQPHGVALGNIYGNSKGYVDAVITDYADGSIHVYPGTGDGSFGTAQVYAVGKNPEAAAIGDFNNDGIADLLVANAGDNTVQVLTGSFVAAPTVTGLSVVQGPLAGGTSVVITGDHLDNALAVNFGATEVANFTVNSSGTQITVSSPSSSAAGIVDVTVTTRGGISATSSADQFTYYDSPSITAISPAYGPIDGVGDITLTGANFSPATSVSVGTTLVTTFTVSSDGKQIVLSAPAGTAGTVHITVTSPYGASANSSADSFTYYSPLYISSMSNTLTATYGASFGPQTFAVSGGSANYSLSESAVSLAPGLLLEQGASGWTLGGTPTATGSSFGMTLKASDKTYSTAADASQSYTLIVNPAALNVIPDSQSVVYGSLSSLPQLTGTLTGVVSSDGITAIYSTNATVSSPVGTYGVTAMLVDPNGKLGNYKVTSETGQFVITQATPKLTLSTPIANASVGSSVNLTATVAGVLAAPEGSVAFYDGNTLLDSVTLNASGVATLSVSSLSIGSHSLTAKYSGDTNYFGASSAALSLNVASATLTITSVSSTSITLSQTGSGTASFIIGENGALSGAVSVACTGLPSTLSCTVSPSTIDASSLPATVTVKVSAAANSAVESARVVPPWLLAMLLPPLAFSFGFGKRYRLRLLPLIVIAATALLGLPSCGGGGRSNSTGAGGLTPIGSYTGAITASNNGVSSQTVNFTVVVAE